MTVWILAICTSGWGLCGSYYEHRYPSEAACYKALEKLVATEVKFAVCKPEENNARS